MLRGRTGVYCWLNKVNGKRYIGSTSRCLKGRKYDHLKCLRANKHYSRHLQHAWTKYGEGNFSFVILAYCRPEDCIKMEQRCIDRYKSADPKYGYNLSPTAGSSRGYKQTEEDKKKKSIARKKWIAANPEKARELAQKCGRNMREKRYGNASSDIATRLYKPRKKLTIEQLREVRIAAAKRMTDAQRGKPLTEKQLTARQSNMRVAQKIRRHQQIANGPSATTIVIEKRKALNRDPEHRKKVKGVALRATWSDPVRRELFVYWRNNKHHLQLEYKNFKEFIKSKGELGSRYSEQLSLF